MKASVFAIYIEGGCRDPEHYNREIEGRKGFASHTGIRSGPAEGPRQDVMCVSLSGWGVSWLLWVINISVRISFQSVKRAKSREPKWEGN